MARLNRLHWEAVPAPVSALLRGLSGVLEPMELYLAGGTALALQLGHRISQDLDLFSPSFADPEALFAALRGRYPSAVATLVEERTLYADVDGWIVSCFGYDYPLLEPLVRVEPAIVPLAHLDDIAAMKLAAIASRGSRKDFIDLWTLVTRGRPLSWHLDRYRVKFAGHDTGHVVRSLTYFDDAEGEPPLQLLADIDWPTVKSDLIRWTRELLGA